MQIFALNNKCADCHTKPIKKAHNCESKKEINYGKNYWY